MEKIEEMRTELETEKSKFSELEVSFASVKLQLDKASDGNNERIEELNSQLEELNNQLSQLNKEMESKDTELQSKKSEIEELEKANAEQRTELEGQKSKLSELEVSLSSAKLQLEQDGDGKNQRIQELNAQVDELNNQLAQLNREIADKDTELQNKKLEIEELEKRNAEQAQELSQQKVIIFRLDNSDSSSGSSKDWWQRDFVILLSFFITFVGMGVPFSFFISQVIFPVYSNAFDYW